MDLVAAGFASGFACRFAYRFAIGAGVPPISAARICAKKDWAHCTHGKGPCACIQAQALVKPPVTLFQADAKSGGGFDSKAIGRPDIG
jgi:hypothetical protein